MTNSKSQKGISVVLFAMMLALIFGMAAICIDIGRSFQEQRRMYLAADAVSFAGANILMNLPTAAPSPRATAFSQIKAVGAANGLNLSNASIIIGNWNSGTGTFNALPTPNPTPNGTPDPIFQGSAVKIDLREPMPPIFARAFGGAGLSPAGRSVSSYTKVTTITTGTPAPTPIPECVKPWGVTKSLLDTVSVGQTITMTKQNSGNWGKVDLLDSQGHAINMSSGSNFRDYMAGDQCAAVPGVGQSLSAGTGFGGSINNVLSGLIGSTWLVPVVSAFPNGNGNVTVYSYARITLISTSGNGNGFVATFRVDAKYTSITQYTNPPTPTPAVTISVTSSRNLVQ